MHDEHIERAAQRAGLKRAGNRVEAEAVSAFLLQPGLFGTRLTPGEEEEFLTRPAATLGLHDDTYWFVPGDRDSLRAVLGVRVNAGRTGIYEVSAFAVHATARHQGLGRAMLAFAIEFVRRSGGRGFLFETSSDPSYAVMHHLLACAQFKKVGHFPEFYYPGEDALWFYQPLPPVAPSC